MPELANPIPKVRVQLDLTATEIETMNWLMEVCDLEKRKDLFNNSVAILEWVVGEVVNGRKIASFDDDTKERTILSMPILSAASNQKRRYAKEKEKDYA